MYIVNMDVWSLQLYLATWTVMSFFITLFSHEVKVTHTQLKPCKENERVCVTNLRDCGPRPPSSVQKTLNMSCYYQKSADRYRSMTCGWSQEPNSHTESDASLMFTSSYKVSSCQGIFNPAGILNVTARIKNYMTGTEIWSQPHTVFLYDAVKPSQPVLTVLGSTEDSLVLSWRSSSDGSCWLRYRLNSTHIWIEVPYSGTVRTDQKLTYTIKDLLPFTVYRAAVACRGKSSIWSDWSSDVSGRTLDRVPSRPPEVCYRVEKTLSRGSLLLHLMWKPPDPREAGGRILGYQLSYEPGRLIQNVTEVMAPLMVEDDNCSVTVTAFNTAGYGPAAHLRIDTQSQNTLPSIRNLWISSLYPGEKALLVQWKIPITSPSALPVSHFAVWWRSETSPSISRWSGVDSFNTSIVIQDVDPDESYLISVFPIYSQQCGPPVSLSASLQQGALMEAVSLKVVDVTKTTVTVVCAWQRKSGPGPIRVNRYRVMLKKDSDTQIRSLWPDQWQHTFFNLTPSTEYSILLWVDDVSRTIIPVTTDFDEVPVVAAATPLLLLAVAVLIISILSRTVYKWYCFPPISSPRGSTTGQWLMDPNLQKCAERSILDIEDFQVTDVVREKSLIMVGPNSQLSSEENLHEDTSLLSISRLIVKLSTLKVDAEYISDSPQTTQQQLVSLQPCGPDRVFISEESREGDAALLHQTHEANLWFPRKEEEDKQSVSQTSHQTDAAMNSVHELLADSHCVYQMSCVAQYVINDAETVSGQIDCSYLICETDYVANTCLRAKTAHEIRSNDFSAA